MKSNLDFITKEKRIMKYGKLLKRFAAMAISGVILLSCVPVQAEETASEEILTEEAVVEETAVEEAATEDVVTYAEGDVPLDAAHFPDANFRECLKEKDFNEDGVLSAEEIACVTILNVSKKNITDMSGLAYFLELTILNCSENSIKSLDLSGNPKLELLQCGKNEITELTGINNKPALEYVHCAKNSISRLDLSGNPKLENVICEDNNITELAGVNNLPSLKQLWCPRNAIKSLDLSGSPKLENLTCQSNSITEVNITACTELTKFVIGWNELTSLDVSKNTKLTFLQVNNNKLTGIDLSNNKALKNFYCDENQLTSLDLSNNMELTNLVCQYNHIPYLELKNHEKLNVFFSYGQTVSVNARQKNGKWTISMKDLIGANDLSRIGVWEDGFEYDASTGMVTLPDEKPETFDYTCKTMDRELPEKDAEYMWVTASINYQENVCPDMPFEDVHETEWFYNYVKYVNCNELMTGLNPKQFGPGQTLARAQFATILYRMENQPAIEYTGKFPDVADGIWYTDPILWASEAGVVTGYTNTGLFGPADNINREQMAVMMYRYAKYKKYDTSEMADFSKFADAGKVNEFAKEAMQWAVGTGIITGKDNGTRIDPQGNAARAECAAIIMRFCEKYGM